jgi:hypothetical protein
LQQRANLCDEAIEQAELIAVLVHFEADLPQLLVQTAQQGRQVAVAQGVAEREGAGELVARGDGLHVGQPDLATVAHVEREFLDLVAQQAGVRADALHQFREGVIGDLLGAGAQFAHGKLLRLGRPVLVSPAIEHLDCAQLVERAVKALALVHLAGADEQAHGAPLEGLEVLGQKGELPGEILRGGHAVVAEEAAIAQPDHLAGAEKGERLHGLTQPGQRGEGFAAVARRGVYRLVVHAADFVAPLLVQLAGALAHGEVILAADQAQGGLGGHGGGGAGHGYSISLPLSFKRSKTSVTSSSWSNSVRAT